MTVPTKWQLAQHWHTSPDRATFARRLEDLATPCCFACGWFSERWEKNTPKASWERATLERAHIVPAGLNGSDDASNIILLCAPCHRDAPDWREPSEMALWIAERPERASKEAEEFDAWCAAARRVPEFGALLAALAADSGPELETVAEGVTDMLWEATQKAGLHASSLSAGTKAAILRSVTTLPAAA